MRFLADECCPKPVVDTLRAMGHDVTYATESHRGCPDDQLLALAFRENRLVLTEDFDFGELAIRRGLPARGVILLAMGSESVAARVRRMQDLVSGHAEALPGHLTIVDARRIRVRPLDPK